MVGAARIIHPYNCHRKANAKWKKHFCTNCKGVGHPKAVCASPIGFTHKNLPGAVSENIFSISTPTGLFTINMPSVKLGLGNSYILDSGSDVSVAPYGTFKKVKLIKETKGNCRLQNASSKELSIYGTNVPF